MGDEYENDSIVQLLNTIGAGQNSGVIDPLSTTGMTPLNIPSAAVPTTANAAIGSGLTAAGSALANYLSSLKGGAKNTAEDMKMAWGDMSTLGKVKTGIGIGTNLLGAYNGIAQQRQAEKTYKFNRDMMQREHANTVNTLNARMADRQAIRHARDPSQHASVSEYLNKYGAK